MSFFGGPFLGGVTEEGLFHIPVQGHVEEKPKVGSSKVRGHFIQAGL